MNYEVEVLSLEDEMRHLLVCLNFGAEDVCFVLRGFVISGLCFGAIWLAEPRVLTPSARRRQLKSESRLHISSEFGLEFEVPVVDL